MGVNGYGPNDFRWQGSKHHLLQELLARLPYSQVARLEDTTWTLWEPFAGGAALHRALTTPYQGDTLLQTYWMRRSVLSDINPLLVVTLQQLQRNIEEMSTLYLAMVDHQQQTTDVEMKPWWDEMCRERISWHEQPARAAARFMFQLTYCLRGFISYDADYHVRAPYAYGKELASAKGRRGVMHTVSSQAERLYRLHLLLRERTSIHLQPYTAITPSPGDLVYLDPPYHDTMDSYNPLDVASFSLADQVRLRDQAVEWHEQGVYVMASNSATREMVDLYSDPPWHLSLVRALNRSSRQGMYTDDQDTGLTEILATTYPTVG